MNAGRIRLYCSDNEMTAKRQRLWKNPIWQRGERPHPAEQEGEINLMYAVLSAFAVTLSLHVCVERWHTAGSHGRPVYLQAKT